MCGIVGIKFFSGQAQKLHHDWIRKALEEQKHRGPDFSQHIDFGNSLLGHNRLAILDLNPRSNQPFLDQSKRYALVFNGEIYNYQELKNELLKKGYHFTTTSDTEVLLNYLIENGEEGIGKLNGCFAFSFYDKLKDVMIIARDHMGINPVLYSILEDGIVFASELRAFSQYPSKKTISNTALNYYFQYTYIPAPFTIYSEVQKLKPGHYIKVDQNKYEIIQYWSPASNEIYSGTYEDACVDLKKILESAVIKRMEADVPLGTFLSGGIDSSIVSLIASSHKMDLNTYSIGFTDSNFIDESYYSQLVAKHINSFHHPVKLNSTEIVPRLAEVLDSFDEPFGDSSAIAMYFLSENTSKDLTVSLSGDGADELFAGYNKHKAFNKKLSNLELSILKFIPSFGSGSRKSYLQNKIRQLNQFKSFANKSWPDNYYYLAQFIEDVSRKKLLLCGNEIVFDLKIESENLNNFLLMDQQFVLSNDMLKKVDLMSMKHSLEVRTPFLDKELVKFANSLPAEYKLKGKRTKSILKDAFKNELPNEIFIRGKKGFEVPIEKWINMYLRTEIPKHWFDTEYLVEQKIFNYKYVQELERKIILEKNENLATLVWCYIVFQNWYDNSIKL